MKYVIVDDGKILKLMVLNSGGIYEPLALVVGKSDAFVNLMEDANKGAEK